jgi:hypothetical protein
MGEPTGEGTSPLQGVAGYATIESIEGQRSIENF